MKALIIIWILAILALLGLVWMVNYAPMPAHALQPAADKYDGYCTGQETVGRCADKPVYVPATPAQPIVIIEPDTTVYAGK